MEHFKFKELFVDGRKKDLGIGNVQGWGTQGHMNAGYCS